MKFSNNLINIPNDQMSAFVLYGSPLRISGATKRMNESKKIMN